MGTAPAFTLIDVARILVGNMGDGDVLCSFDDFVAARLGGDAVAFPVRRRDGYYRAYLIPEPRLFRGELVFKPARRPPAPPPGPSSLDPEPPEPGTWVGPSRSGYVGVPDVIEPKP